MGGEWKLKIGVSWKGENGSRGEFESRIWEREVVEEVMGRTSIQKAYKETPEEKPERCLMNVEREGENQYSAGRLIHTG